LYYASIKKVAVQLELDVLEKEKLLLDKKENSCRHELIKAQETTISIDRKIVDTKERMEICFRQRDFALWKKEKIDFSQCSHVW